MKSKNVDIDGGKPTQSNDGPFRIRPAFGWLVGITFAALAVTVVITNWQQIIAVPFALFGQIYSWCALHWLAILMVVIAYIVLRFKVMVHEYMEQDLAIKRRELGKLNQLIRYARGISLKINKIEDDRKPLN